MPLYQVNAPKEIATHILDALETYQDINTIIALVIELFALACDPSDLRVVEHQMRKIRVLNVPEACLYFVELTPRNRNNSMLSCHVETLHDKNADSDCTSCCSDSTFELSDYELGPE
jgi:hypothetical protein